MRRFDSAARVPPDRTGEVLRDIRGRELDTRPIRGLIQRIVDRWDPQRIWLFGSRARGDAMATSDWDLLLVVSDDLPERELDPLSAWRLRRDSGASADIVLCTVEEFEEDRTTPNTLAFEAWTRGILLHER